MGSSNRNRSFPVWICAITCGEPTGVSPVLLELRLAFCKNAGTVDCTSVREEDQLHVRSAYCVPGPGLAGRNLVLRESP